jgi:hypothetical protein
MLVAEEQRQSGRTGFAFPGWIGGVNAPRELRISSEKHTGTRGFPAV